MKTYLGDCLDGVSSFVKVPCLSKGGVLDAPCLGLLLALLFLLVAPVFALIDPGLFLDNP